MTFHCTYLYNSKSSMSSMSEPRSQQALVLQKYNGAGVGACAGSTGTSAGSSASARAGACVGAGVGGGDEINGASVGAGNGGELQEHPREQYFLHFL
jgi:hypothetical protein